MPPQSVYATAPARPSASAAASSHSGAQFLKTGYVSPFRRRKEQEQGSNLEWERGCVDMLRLELMEEPYLGRPIRREATSLFYHMANLYRGAGGGL